MRALETLPDVGVAAIVVEAKGVIEYTDSRYGRKCVAFLFVGYGD